MGGNKTERSPVAVERPPAVFIETHGCKLNQADSQALAWRFAQAGYCLVEETAQADVCLVNTCTVTHVADRKARHALRDARRHNPHAVVVATGCYAQRAPHQLAQLDGVNLVLGNTQKDILVNQVNQLLDLPKASCSTGTPRSEEAVASLRTRAMVKIQEGCDQVCAYCIVPKVRGRERSIHPDVVVALIQRLVAEGCQEVVLTGTQLGTYGFETPGPSLAGLINRILRRTSVPRLRVSSLQPQELSPELLDLWDDSRLCPHFHLPLQSGSAAVLKAMRRRYSPQQYVDAVEGIQQRVPRATVTTDVIVGFPGETEERFQESYQLCQEVRFAGFHIFPYSARPGTSAAHLEPKVEAREKRLRMVTMLALAREQVHSYRQSLLGTTCPVLWETSRSVAGAQIWSGLTDNYVRVATVSPQSLCNRITPVALEHQEAGVVWGRVPDHRHRPSRHVG
ncbi:tRNA (N(6)-L-threonylcarbamoyladenosine(37)-C(2))-methylthiotransferase MtaB [Chloroflexota bacterium]